MDGIHPQAASHIGVDAFFESLLLGHLLLGNVAIPLQGNVALIIIVRDVLHLHELLENCLNFSVFFVKGISTSNVFLVR